MKVYKHSHMQTCKHACTSKFPLVHTHIIARHTPICIHPCVPTQSMDNNHYVGIRKYVTLFWPHIRHTDEAETTGLNWRDHVSKQWMYRMKWIAVSLQYLPDNTALWPPIAIRCVDCRKFGREVLVGTHIVNQVIKYFHEDETTEARKLSSNLSGIIKSNLFIHHLSEIDSGVFTINGKIK